MSTSRQEVTGLISNAVIGGGKGDFFRTPRMWMEYRRHAPLDRAGLLIPDPVCKYYKLLKKGDDAWLEYGYRDHAPGHFVGEVDGLQPGNKDQLDLSIVSPAKPLSTVPLTFCMEWETCDVIVSYAIGAAGLPVGRVDNPGPALPHFISQGQTAWQVAARCAASMQRGFGIDMSRWAMWWSHSDQVVNWGDFDEPGEIPRIESLDNLIVHAPSDQYLGLSRITTYLQPSLTHSQLVRLWDQRRALELEVRAQIVRHELSDQGRTLIWYGQEHSRVC